VILARIIPQEYVVLLVYVANVRQESFWIMVCPKDQRVLLLFRRLVEKLVFKSILVVEVRVQERVRQDSVVAEGL
jgi:hypothetical protein